MKDVCADSQDAQVETPHVFKATIIHWNTRTEEAVAVAETIDLDTGEVGSTHRCPLARSLPAHHFHSQVERTEMDLLPQFKTRD